MTESPEDRSEMQTEEAKIIGLTGGIGSGKSTLALWIEEAGFPVYNSDRRSKLIVQKDAQLRLEITELLGTEAYDENGAYNRAFVSSQVFENAELLQKLNSLIHPAVKKDFLQWFQSKKSNYVFKETALLFELGLDADCYKSILVTADDNLRMKRVMERDGKTYREVEQVMDKQMPEKEKIRKADFIIYNNSTIEEMQQQVSMLVQNFRDGTV